MLINKINILNPANNIYNKNFAKQNSPHLKHFGGDVFVSFKGTPKEEKPTPRMTPEIQKTIDFLIAEDPTKKDENPMQLLHDKVMIDPLTGLNNKRAFYADLKRNIQAAKDQGQGISVAMFDMDNFKSVNDLLGHGTGDKFLSILGQEIGKVAEQSGYRAYRYGGEEFVILMPGASSETAAKIAEEVRKNINQNPEIQAQSYHDDYIAEAQRLTAELEAQQKPFVDFKNKLKEYEVRENDFKNLKNTGATSETRLFFAKSMMTTSIIELKESFQSLLENVYAHTTSESGKKYLSDKIESFGHSGEVTIEYDEDLKNYLNTNFNKESQIAQIATWVNTIMKPVDGKPQGFTITGGVKEFSNLNIPVENFIDETDLVLSKGKKEVKGLVYVA